MVLPGERLCVHQQIGAAEHAAVVRAENSELDQHESDAGG
jgi:hypothetical protein